MQEVLGTSSKKLSVLFMRHNHIKYLVFLLILDFEYGHTLLL